MLKKEKRKKEKIAMHLLRRKTEEGKGGSTKDTGD